MAGIFAAAHSLRPDSRSYHQNILDAPEQADLRRLTELVAHLFRVPVAYMALLGTEDEVVARVGNGAEYAAVLGALKLDDLLAKPQLVRDAARDLPPGTDLRGLRFAASALLRFSSGVHFGILVIADRVPRPDFSAADFRALAELAGVLAGKMELRMVAGLALETELALRETGQRFHGLANCAPVPIICSRADGFCTFVNRTWLDFSGRSAEQELQNGWVSLIHPDYRQRVLDQCRHAMALRGPFAAEAPVRRRDGVYRWMLGKGAPLFREDGSFDGYVGCLIDIGDYRGPGKVTCPAPKNAGQAGK